MDEGTNVSEEVDTLGVPELDRSRTVIFLESEEYTQCPLHLPASPMSIFVHVSKISGDKFTIFTGTLSIFDFIITSKLFIQGSKTCSWALLSGMCLTLVLWRVSETQQ